MLRSVTHGHVRNSLPDSRRPLAVGRWPLLGLDSCATAPESHTAAATNGWAEEEEYRRSARWRLTKDGAVLSPSSRLLVVTYIQARFFSLKHQREETAARVLLFFFSFSFFPFLLSSICFLSLRQCLCLALLCVNYLTPPTVSKSIMRCVCVASRCVALTLQEKTGRLYSASAYRTLLYSSPQQQQRRRHKKSNPIPSHPVHTALCAQPPRRGGWEVVFADIRVGHSVIFYIRHASKSYRSPNASGRSGNRRRKSNGDGDGTMGWRGWNGGGMLDGCVTVPIFGEGGQGQTKAKRASEFSPLTMISNA